MNWLDRLERKFPQLALEGLIRYISFLMMMVFFLDQSRLLPYEMLYLDSHLIMQGQVWRLFTFLLIPKSTSLFFLIFELTILVMCADGLESEWGTFKLTVYYLFGALANIAIAFVMPQAQLGSYFLYLTLFLGFATLYPDFELLLFFIIPIKIKYLALLSALWIVLALALNPWPEKIAILLSVGNYLLFFGPDFFKTAQGNYRASARRREFAEKTKQPDGPRHVCSICGRNEIENPELQFRYCTCSRCGENGVAFCLEHLKQHKNVDSRETTK